MPTPNTTPQPSADLMIFGRFALFNDGGRLNRTAYCLGFHGVVLLLTVFMALDTLLVTPGLTDWLGPGNILLQIWPLLLPGVGLRLFLGLTARRFHDVGRPTSDVVLLLIPVFGAFLLLSLFILPGEARTNAWGEPPPALL